MKLGVVYPQTELGPDPGVVREFAQAVEDMGYSHIAPYEHVVGADPAQHPGFSGAYTHRSLFHEPFVLFGYLSAVTRRLELVTNILVLPQRQTVLVAKQAAEADVLSGGRLRL
ncbi:MAG: LLM class flavin-dependent oxidoreductase, partial [SAR202 cluster bacterium]|nr:LLM class flavin-dependent oxidoreductase [SAR202 cluster bacterium]